MEIWKILGIERTNDIKAIKKAYAEKAKEVHPEEHPEAFRQLHNAYVDALNYAKNTSTAKLNYTVVLETEVVTKIQQQKEQNMLENTIEEVMETATAELENQIFLNLDNKTEQGRNEVFSTVDMILNPSSSKVVRSRCVETLLANEYFYYLLTNDDIVMAKFIMILNLECLSRKDIRKILKFLKLKNKEKVPAVLKEIMKLLRMPIYGFEQTVFLFPHFTYVLAFLISPFIGLDIKTNFFSVIIGYVLVLMIVWLVFVYSKTEKAKEVRMKISPKKKMKNFLTIYNWVMIALFYVGLGLMFYAAAYVGDYYSFEVLLFDKYYEFSFPVNNTMYGILALSGIILLQYYRKVKTMFSELQSEFYNKS